MKVRKLKQLLDNTDYIVSNQVDCICVGSPLCTDLLAVNVETKKVTYALDHSKKGRAALNNEGLLFIWDRLHELIDSGEMDEILTGFDELENPLPLFGVVNGELLCRFTDAYGWPNTDQYGFLQYKNVHFDNKRDALIVGINRTESEQSYCESLVQKTEKGLKLQKKELTKCKAGIANLEKLLAELDGATSEV